MPLQDKVVWYDGMFLRPQHFQQQDRYLEGLIRDRCGHLRPHDWGILELELDLQALRAGKLTLSKARGILPDGSPFAIPDLDEPPEPLDMESDWQNTDVFLVLPVVKDRGDIDREEGIGGVSRYRAVRRDVRDLNVGCESREQPVKVAKRQFRLWAETQGDRGGYTGIAVARVIKKRADQVVELDEDFIPPCLNCVGSPVLSKFLTELQGLLSLCSQDITKRLGGAPLAGDNALEDLLLLQAANRYRLLMDHFSDMLYLHPEDLYRTALQMVGELATLAREGRVPRWQLASYDHNDLRGTFEPVMQELRHCLEWRRRRVVIEIPIEYRGRGRYLARLDESQRSLLDEADFFLLARVREDRSGHFPDRCTISAPPELMGLVAKHLPGIALRPQRTVPPGLPFDREFTYFELQRDDVHWESFKTSSAIAFHVGGDQPGLMQLYAIRHE